MRILHLPASLRTRLLLLVLFTVIPAFALLVHQSVEDYDQAQLNIKREALAIAYRIAAFTKEIVPEPHQFLANLAQAPEILHGGDACNDFVASVLKSNQYFSIINVIRPDGEPICSTRPLDGSVNLSDRLYFKRVIESQSYAIGEYVVGRRSGKPAITFALPILDTGKEIKAVISVSLDLGWLNEGLTKATFREGTVVAAVDSAGTLLAGYPHYPDQYIGKRVPEWEQIEPIVATRSDVTVEETWRDGVLRVTAFVPLFTSSTGDIYLRVGIPKETALAGVWAEFERNIMLMGLAAFIAFAAAWVGSDWLVLRPAHALTYAARRLGEGEVNARTGLPHTRDELGQLAMSFDGMAQRLQTQQEDLRRVNRALTVLSAGNHAMLRAKDEQGLLNDICQVVVTIGGYRMAWIGYVEHDERKSIRLMAHAGANGGFLASLEASWGDNERGRGPSGTAIRTGKLCVVRNNLGDANVAVWRAELVKRGYASALGLPIKIGADVIGALVIAAAEPDTFSEREMELLSETVDDLAFGIAALRTQIEVEKTRIFLESIVDNMPSMLFVKDAKELRFVRFNKAGEALTGFSERELLGKNDYDFFPQEQADFFIAKDRETLTGSRKLDIVEEPLRARDGTERILHTKKLPILDERGDPKYLLGISEDITERKRQEETIRRLAYFDSITGLPNRVQLDERLAQAIKEAQAQNRSVAVLAFNVNHFDDFRDALGYRESDSLLREIGLRLQKATAENETVAHLGEGKFAFLLPEGDAGRAVQVTMAILAAVNTPFLLGGIELTVQGSIGIALSPGHGVEPEHLVLRAFIAAVQAGRAGTEYTIYSGTTDGENARRLTLIGELRRAIENDQLILHYQPKIDSKTGALNSVEALVRWRHPELGNVSPGVFIPLAEHTGLIKPLTYWVFAAACRQGASWREAGINVPIACNLSVRNFHDPALVDRIKELMASSGSGGASFQIEITESTLMEDAKLAKELLTRLADLGIEVYIDDFGTGYSSLSYITKLPIAGLKIDRAFVMNMASDPNSMTVVSTIISLAHSLNLKVVAEGVETDEQAKLLKLLRCDEMQGYLFGRPEPADQLKRLTA